MAGMKADSVCKATPQLRSNLPYVVACHGYFIREVDISGNQRDMEQDRDLELREIFSKLLDAPGKKKTIYDHTDERITYSWEEIFCELGRLRERATKALEKSYTPEDRPSLRPFENVIQACHYHNGYPCYKNPCVWC
jgi:hypothetical protein